MFWFYFLGLLSTFLFFFFFFNDTATTEIYTLSLHDALPIGGSAGVPSAKGTPSWLSFHPWLRSPAGVLRSYSRSASPSRSARSSHPSAASAAGQSASTVSVSAVQSSYSQRRTTKSGVASAEP